MNSVKQITVKELKEIIGIPTLEYIPQPKKETVRLSNGKITVELGNNGIEYIDSLDCDYTYFDFKSVERINQAIRDKLGIKSEDILHKLSIDEMRCLLRKYYITPKVKMRDVVVYNSKDFGYLRFGVGVRIDNREKYINIMVNMAGDIFLSHKEDECLREYYKVFYTHIKPFMESSLRKGYEERVNSPFCYDLDLLEVQDLLNSAPEHPQGFLQFKGYNTEINSYVFSVQLLGLKPTTITINSIKGVVASLPTYTQFTREWEKNIDSMLSSTYLSLMWNTYWE